MRGNELVLDRPIRCYDNGGATWDRYTVIYIGQLAVAGRTDLFECLGMSTHPFASQGFGQHSAAMPGKHLGRRIPFTELPEDCQKAVLRDLKAETSGDKNAQQT